MGYIVAMAKQKKPADDTRKKPLRIRLTDSERSELDRAAQERSLDTSTWARMELLLLARGKSSGERGLRSRP
jgi:hypothetical protein